VRGDAGDASVDPLGDLAVETLLPVAKEETTVIAEGLSGPSQITVSGPFRFVPRD